MFASERVPFPKPPRALADRYYTVVAWAEYDTGGHFPAVAEPALLVRILPTACYQRPSQSRRCNRHQESPGTVRWVRDRGVVLLHDDLAADLKH
jgi:hypothetical protein